MGTTIEKLNKLKATKEAIRTAINNKGGTLTKSDTFTSYATAIDNIQSGGGDNPLQYFIDNRSGDGIPNCSNLCRDYQGSSLDDVFRGLDTSRVTNMYGMFSRCHNIKNIPQFNTSSCTNMEAIFYRCLKIQDIPQLDTSKVTNMKQMFNFCYELRSISSLDTSSCTNMSDMFSGCQKLKSIPQLYTSNVTDMDSIFRDCQEITTIPQLDTSKVTIMSGMFSSCNKIINIPPLDTSKVTTMGGMFYGCSSLTNISQLDTSSCTTMWNMFVDCFNLQTIDITYMKTTSADYSSKIAYNCHSLKKFIIRNMDTIPVLNSNSFSNCYHFYGTIASTYNPEGLKDGRIYVPDDKVEELKTATNWSVFADIIVPLSTLVEDN